MRPIPLSTFEACQARWRLAVFSSSLADREECLLSHHNLHLQMQRQTRRRTLVSLHQAIPLTPWSEFAVRRTLRVVWAHVVYTQSARISETPVAVAAVSSEPGVVCTKTRVLCYLRVTATTSSKHMLRLNWAGPPPVFAGGCSLCLACKHRVRWFCNSTSSHSLELLQRCLVKPIKNPFGRGFFYCC